MKLLIIGGEGMIGQAIVKRHLAEGDEVYVYDTHVNPYNDYSHSKGIILQFPPTPDILNDVDLISYQAAHVGVGESMYKPWKYMDNNVGDLAMLLETLIDNDIKKPFMFAGSMGIHGEGDYFCTRCRKAVTAIRFHGVLFCEKCYEFLREDNAIPARNINPVSFYGLSKYTQEKMIEIYAKTYGVAACSLRYFSVYATDQNPLNPYTGLLTIIGNQLLNNDNIYINESGRQRRDMIHVDDVASAHYEFTQKTIYTAPAGGVIRASICTGSTHSMQEISEALLSAYNEELRARGLKEVSHKIIPKEKYRAGDVFQVIGDCEEAERSVWTAKHILSDDIKTYAKFLVDNRDKFIGSSWADEEKRASRIMR